MSFLDATTLQTATQADKRQAVEELVKSADEGDRKDVADAAVSVLTPEQRAELAKS